ncbi:LysM peptidoglycan-binding domain-containing protein [Chloroflexi bacterium TSY]|nr:LysM peptidoglycan-binding domain-containing protein [Chloroflexi bacterium TSY]
MSSASNQAESSQAAHQTGRQTINPYLERSRSRPAPPYFERALDFTKAGLILLLFLLLVLFAFLWPWDNEPDDPGGGGTIPPPHNVCVTGTVLNHQDQPVSAGWVIVATPRRPSGELDPPAAVHTVSKPDGTFQYQVGLYPGTWQFRLVLQNGWEAVTPHQVDLILSENTSNCKIIHFRVEQRVIVQVLKIDEDQTPLPSWGIRAEPGPSNQFAQSVERTTGADGIATFRLTPGSWTFIEYAPDGLLFEPLIPQSGIQQLIVEPPGPLDIRFQNRIIAQTGCIDVYKYEVPQAGEQAYGLPGWRITLQDAEDKALVDETLTDAMGHLRFNDLALGLYLVLEEERAGWSPVAPSSHQVRVSQGQCQEIIFYNQQTPSDCHGDCCSGQCPPPTYPPKPPDDPCLPGNGYIPPNKGKIPSKPYKPCPPVGSDDPYGHNYGPSDCRQTHIVSRGQWMYNIARHYGISVSSLFHANPWVHHQPRRFLYPGQKLCIPQRS